MFAPLNGEALNGSANGLWVSATAEAGADTQARFGRIRPGNGLHSLSADTSATGVRECLVFSQVAATASIGISAVRQAFFAGTAESTGVSLSPAYAERFLDGAATHLASTASTGVRNAFPTATPAESAAEITLPDDQALVFAVAKAKPVRGRAQAYVNESHVREIITNPVMMRGFTLALSGTYALANAVIAHGKGTAHADSVVTADGNIVVRAMVGTITVEAGGQTDPYRASVLAGRSYPEAASVAVPNITTEGVTYAYQTAVGEARAELPLTVTRFRQASMKPLESTSEMALTSYLDRGMESRSPSTATTTATVDKVFQLLRLRRLQLTANANAQGESIRYRWVGVEATGVSGANASGEQIRYRWVGIEAEALTTAAVNVVALVTRRMMGGLLIDAATQGTSARLAFLKAQAQGASESASLAQVYGFHKGESNTTSAARSQGVSLRITSRVSLDPAASVAEVGQLSFYINAGTHAPAGRSILLPFTPREIRVSADR